MKKGKKAKKVRVKAARRRPVKRKPLVRKRPAGAAAPPRGRPANNTTADIYFAPNVPPAAPDVAGVPVHLAPRFAHGSESSEGDQDLRWTHIAYVSDTVDVRDNYPSAPTHTLYVPDKTGTGFEVVFVELVGRGTGSKYKRIFLDRQQPAWPTNQL